ncbi:MAG: hypothetical protein FJ026_08690, partial [Chloroflexi bacterium]|nr:hypothetical protein [Chloroflexota bacterium]
MHKRPCLLALVVVFLGAALPSSLADQKPSLLDRADPLAATQTTWLQLPLYFVENRGQTDPRVAFYVQGHDKTLYFTSQGITLALSGPRLDSAGPGTRVISAPQIAARPAFAQTCRFPSEPTRREQWALKLEFLGANGAVLPVGQQQTPATVSYFKGPPAEWKANLKTYSSIVYPELWPGIDLVYSGTTDRLKYQFVVRPGADPGQIRLAYRGATTVSLDEAGRLQVSTPVDAFHDDRPMAYQDRADGQRTEVEVTYQTFGAFAYGFRLGSYDPTQTLVIDPALLVYCGYIGGADDDRANGIAVDRFGCAYVTGYTESDATSFPVGVGPSTVYSGGYADVFVAKIDAAGSGLIYCGYIGGDRSEVGYDIAVDAGGRAYVIGSAESDEGSFPVTIGPYLTHSGDQDAFVARVNASGTGLDYCGYVGGLGSDWGNGIAVDSAGHAYLTGYTESSENRFPVTDGPDRTYNGQGDAFVAKVKADGSGLDYCGYIGGSFADWANSIAVDSAGQAYVAGYTDSDESSFPVLGGPYLTYRGGFDAFVASVQADGLALRYCGYVGGSDYDEAYGIALDGEGRAWLTGYTESDQTSFPVAVGPDLSFNGGFTDAFVARVRADGSGLESCGYLGGSGLDVGRSIAVDSNGNVHITGYTESSQDSFPVTGGPDLTYNSP